MDIWYQLERGALIAAIWGLTDTVRRVADEAGVEARKDAEDLLAAIEKRWPADTVNRPTPEGGDDDGRE